MIARQKEMIATEKEKKVENFSWLAAACALSDPCRHAPAFCSCGGLHRLQTSNV